MLTAPDYLPASLLMQLKHMTGLPQEAILPLLQLFEYTYIPEKTLLLEAGKVAREMYLLLEGCFRLYYIKDGTDISAYFFTENMFAGSYDSFITQQPGLQFIETVEPCKVLTISYPLFQQLLQGPGEMNAFVRKILEERFIALHQLFQSQILESPKERYLSLIKYHPSLLHRVPQHQIATFLGITPVSLSRIRNRIARSGK